jgi:hypothetical protein
MLMKDGLSESYGICIAHKAPAIAPVRLRSTPCNLSSRIRLPLYGFEPNRSPAIMLKGGLSSMNHGTSSDRALLREAFELLLGLRSRPQARKLLGQAVTFLRMLEHQREPGGLPVVISIQLMRLRKF